MVKSLVAEEAIHQKYMAKLIEKEKKDLKMKIYVCILLGVSQLGLFMIYGTVYIAFAYWHEKYHISTKDFYTGIFSLFFGVYGAGMANQLMGDVGKAQAAKKK